VDALFKRIAREKLSTMSPAISLHLKIPSSEHVDWLMAVLTQSEKVFIIQSYPAEEPVGQERETRDSNVASFFARLLSLQQQIQQQQHVQGQKQ
jgi:hypothetical protein